MIFSVSNIEETTSIGYELGKLLNSGDIICLTGDLGTGKTHITKGIANQSEDPKISEEQIIGKIIYKTVILSFITKIVNNLYGFYFLLFVPIVVLTFIEIIKAIEEKKEEKEEKRKLKEKEESKKQDDEEEL